MSSSVCVCVCVAAKFNTWILWIEEDSLGKLARASIILEHRYDIVAVCYLAHPSCQSKVSQSLVSLL